MDNRKTLGHAKMWTTNLNWQERFQIILLRLPSGVCGRQLLVRQLTSGNFSGRPFSPPAFTCRSHSHQPSKSLSTWWRAPPIARAATQQKTAQNSSSKLIWSSLWDMKTAWKLIFQLEPKHYPASTLRTIAHSASMSRSQMQIEFFFRSKWYSQTWKTSMLERPETGSRWILWPACDSPPGVQPKPPSKFLQVAMKSVLFFTSTLSSCFSSERQQSAQ